MSITQVSRWCFTHFVPDEQDSSPPPFTISDEDLKHFHVRYWIVQLERASSTGRLHYQGYIHFERSIRMSSVKAIRPLDETTHLEPANGSVQSNIEYCSKDETRVAGPWSYGTIPSEVGSRTDFEVFREAVRDRRVKDRLDVLEEYPAMLARYPKFVDSCFEVFSKGALSELPVKTVIWLHGSPGLGKSRFARALLDAIDQPFYELALGTGSSGSLWFDGLGSENALLIDDVSPSVISGNTLLRLLDRYSYRVQYKGGSKLHYFQYVILTSNVSPLAFTEVASGSLLRRCCQITVEKAKRNDEPPYIRFVVDDDSQHLPGMILARSHHYLLADWEISGMKCIMASSDFHH